MTTTSPIDSIGLNYIRLVDVLHQTYLLIEWGAPITALIGATLVLSGLERRIGKRLLVAGLIIWIVVLVF
jgi:hypothetical protein